MLQPDKRPLKTNQQHTYLLCSNCQNVWWGLTKEFYQFRLSLQGYFGPVFLDCRSTRILIRAILSMYAIWQGCGLGLDVSVSRRSRDLSKVSSRSRLGHVGKRLGLVSVSGAKVSVMASVSTNILWAIMPNVPCQHPLLKSSHALKVRITASYACTY